MVTSFGIGISAGARNEAERTEVLQRAIDSHEGFDLLCGYGAAPLGVEILVDVVDHSEFSSLFAVFLGKLPAIQEQKYHRENQQPGTQEIFSPLEGQQTEERCVFLHMDSSPQW